MAKGIKGIIIEIGGDTSGLQKALSSVNSATSSLSKELRGVNSLLKLDPKNTELLAQKQTILNENIDQTKNKLQQLKEIEAQATEKGINKNKEQQENWRALQREIINTENKLNDLTEDLKQFYIENSNWTKAGRKAEEYSEKISKVTKKIDEVGNKASIVSGAVVAGGTVLVNSAMNLEDAIAKYINTTNTAKEETEKYKEVLEKINRNNYGDGYEDIANAMSNVKMQLKDLDSQNLQNVTEKALAFRDLFGYEVPESIRAVKAMMDNFNISTDEAFNLLAEGKKQGLDFSNELLDNVNEYSVQFKKLGFTADDMFNIFKSGAENGAFNLDKIGDAVKEFSIRAIDGSNTTIEGFKKIGLNANTMAKKFAQGGDVAKQAFIEVVQKIGNMDNKVEQSIVGVDLFGTMWEDLGPTVVTSFTKMDNGISKSSNSMQDSIDGLYDTTKKKAEAQLKRLQSLGADFGKEMLPTLEKIIDKAEEFIKSLEGMSDAEKENILKIGLFVAIIGPATKALGATGKIIGTTTKGIGMFSQAVGLMGKTSTDAFDKASKGTQVLAKSLTGLTSPVGLATLGIGYLTIAWELATRKAKEQTKEVKELTNSINDEINTRMSVVKSVNDNMSANLSEIDNIKRLKDELSNLVDENGNVKKGYESRTDFILNELNNALGTEYSRTGDIINGYKDLGKTIDDIIAKKRAQIVLEADEEKYKTAIQNKNKAYKTYLDIQDKISAKQKEINEFKQMHKYAMNTSDISNYKELQKQLDELNKSLGNSQNEINEYNNTITRYEKNSELVIKGGLENYQKVYKSIEQTESNTTKTQEKEMTKRIQSLQSNLRESKRLYDLEAENNKNAKDNIYKTNVEESQKNLQLAVNELISMTNTTGEMSPDVIQAWKDLAQNSRIEYDKIIEKMPADMQDKINRIVGIVNADTSVSNSVSNLGNQALSVLRKDNEFEETGKNWIRGINRGINNKLLRQEALSSMRGFGVDGLQAVQKTWDEHSPSKETEKLAINFLKGVPVGLKKEVPRTLNTMEDVAQKLLDRFNFTDISNISNIPKMQSNLTQKINASVTPKIITPNITINTQQLTATEMDRIIDTINIKFGKMY